MGESSAGMRGCDVMPEDGNAVTGAADFLYLAAAPTFAVMALLTGVLGGGPGMRCARSPACHRSAE